MSKIQISLKLTDKCCKQRVNVMDFNCGLKYFKPVIQDIGIFLIWKRVTDANYTKTSKLYFISYEIISNLEYM